jgi:tRNA(Ile)-lysidine synthetase-like protein
MCLLQELLSILPKESIAAAHFNHRCRGEESDRDAAFVREHCQGLGIAFFEGSRNASGHASELVMRNARREFLESVAEQSGFAFICTAHHANDQLETLLMRLMRGTDWRGMGGIRYLNGKWLRPLLHVSRAEIERYARKHQVPYRTDGSNYETKYLRNALRHGVAEELLQVAENAGMPAEAVLRNVGHWCERAQQVHSYLSSEADRVLALVSTETPFWVRVHLAQWNLLSEPVQQVALNRLVEKHLGATLCRKQLNLWLDHLAKKQNRFHLKPGVRVRVSFEYWYLCLSEKAPEPPLQPAPGRYYFSDIHCDLEVAEGKMEARYYQSGDRFESTGLKLKDYFQKTRVPAPERSFIPVLVRPNTAEVLWCLGYGHNASLITKQTCGFPFAASNRAVQQKSRGI